MAALLRANTRDCFKHTFLRTSPRHRAAGRGSSRDVAGGPAQTVPPRAAPKARTPLPGRVGARPRAIEPGARCDRGRRRSASSIVDESASAGRSRR